MTTWGRPSTGAGVRSTRVTSVRARRCVGIVFVVDALGAELVRPVIRHLALAALEALVALAPGARCIPRLARAVGAVRRAFQAVVGHGLRAVLVGHGGLRWQVVSQPTGRAWERSAPDASNRPREDAEAVAHDQSPQNQVRAPQGASTSRTDEGDKRLRRGFSPAIPAISARTPRLRVSA